MPRSLPVVLTLLGIVCAVFAAVAAHKPDRSSAPVEETSPADQNQNDGEEAVTLSRPEILPPVQAPAPEPKPAIDDLTDYCIFAAEVDPDWSWPKEGVDADLDWNDEHRLTEKLETTADVHLDEVPFREFLSIVARRGRINIFVEPQGLQKAGMTLESPVTIHVETIRLRSILSLMLLGTGLDYELRQGLVVVIASRDKELITRRYPIGDLAYEKSAEGRRFAPEPLIALLRENDGYGAIIGGGILYKQSGPIELDEEAQTLVITQTIDAHALIAARLADLRQIKRQYAAKGDIDFPTLERIVAKHAGYVPFHQLLENKIVWVEVDKADGVRFTIDERTFDSLYEVLQFLQQQSDNVLRPGILLSRDGSRGTVDEATLAAMEYFCRNYDVDLFAFKSAWPRRGAFEAQPFRAFKSTRSPYADEP